MQAMQQVSFAPDDFYFFWATASVFSLHKSPFLSLAPRKPDIFGVFQNVLYGVQANTTRDPERCFLDYGVGRSAEFWGNELIFPTGMHSL
jgi:hypothetical protein